MGKILALVICMSMSIIWGASAQTQPNHVPNNISKEWLDEQWNTTEWHRKNRPYRVLFYGDSIFSGYGLANPEKSVVNTIMKNFNDDYFVSRDTRFKNLSHAGETTAGAVTRIKSAIALRPDVLVLAIGGNDAMRGIDPDIVYNNLNIILRDLTRAGVYTMLVGMQATPSYGYDYVSKFNSVYAKLAEQYNVVFMPFLLEGVAGNRMLNQRDGIHPTAEGAAIVAENISEYLWRMLQQVDRYQKRLEEIERHKDYMRRRNEGARARGLPPRHTQEEIDNYGKKETRSFNRSPM